MKLLSALQILSILVHMKTILSELSNPKEMEKEGGHVYRYLKMENDTLLKYPYKENDSISLTDFAKSLKRKSLLLTEDFMKSSVDAELEDDEENEIEVEPIYEKMNLDSEDEEKLKEAELTSKYHLFSGNKNRTSDGDYIVDGDIVVFKDEDDEDELSTRKATSTVSPSLKNLIEKAFEHWRDSTCLTFDEKKLFDFNYVKFRGDKDGCWSLLGRQMFKLSGQEISIGNGCEDRDIIVHEIGHAVGLHHEQSRSDRDAYIHLLLENVTPGMEPQFEKADDRNFNIPYDYSSVMQYPKWAFSMAPFEKNTIVTMDPHHQRLLAKANGLSFRDRKIISMLYSCNATCPNVSTTICQNDGYLKPYRDQPKNCTCECPHGVFGEFCENVQDDYYGKLPCSFNVTNPGIIQTPNYPERKEPNEDCSWWIKAPEGKKVQLEILDFSFDKRLNYTSHPLHGRCVFEQVEIRTEDRYNGVPYCANDLPKGKMFTSKDTELILILFANKYKVGRGFQGNVVFI